MKKFIITIDGPAGAGKTTMAKLLAKNLGLNYLDMGSIYRYVTLVGLRKRLDLENTGEMIRLIRSIKLKRQPTGRAIRSKHVTRNAFKVANNSLLRGEINKLIRRLASSKSKGIVTEGRDQGSVVFPRAQVKFFLDAKLSERAARRQKEVKGTRLKVVSDLRLRDRRDRTRKAGPLVREADMIYIDSTGRSINKVLQRMLRFAKNEVMV